MSSCFQTLFILGLFHVNVFMYFVAEQTQQRSGFEASFTLKFIPCADHVVRGVATKRISWQGLKRDTIVSSGAVCGQKSPPPPPPSPYEMYAMIVISLKLFMNFSERLRRLGTPVKVQFPLETLPKKSVKNFSHQAAYNNDVTFLDFCLRRAHIKFLSDFRVSSLDFLFFSVFS